jgi:hypothetical protein
MHNTLDPDFLQLQIYIHKNNYLHNGFTWNITKLMFFLHVCIQKRLPKTTDQDYHAGSTVALWSPS